MAGSPLPTVAPDALASAAVKAADAAASASGSASAAAHSAGAAVDVAAGAATAAAHSGSLSYAAIIGAATALIAALASWAASRRQSLKEERSAAFGELMKVVETLRADHETLKEELASERSVRRGIESDLRKARGELALLHTHVKALPVPRTRTGKKNLTITTDSSASG